MKKGVEKRHSETAIFAALYRALANKEYKNERFGSDYLAEYFLPSHFKLIDVLKNAGYKKNEKALFIWEGVSYYLEPKSVDATLEFVNHFAQYESVIAFDYTISISGESIHNYYGAIEFAQSMKKHHQTERFRFNIDEGKIEPFLKQRGLRIISHLNNQEIEKTFLLNDNGSLTGQITGLFRFAMASPNSDRQNE